MEKFIVYNVPVSFMGTVQVKVPSTVPAERQACLAEKLAKSRILAIVENPDAPDDVACEQYEEEFSLSESKAGKEWDQCEVTSVSGVWSAGV